MRLQKHERQAVSAIRAIADAMAIRAQVLCRGRHHCKVELIGPGGREVIGIPCSPDDPVWAVRVAVKQAIKACDALRVRA